MVLIRPFCMQSTSWSTGVHVLEMLGPVTRGSYEAAGPRRDMGREATRAVTNLLWQGACPGAGEEGESMAERPDR